MLKLLKSFAFSLFLAACHGEAPAATPSLADAVEKAEQSVLSFNSEHTGCAAVAIAKNVIVTASHCVEEDKGAAFKTMSGEVVEALPLVFNEERDFAVFEVVVGFPELVPAVVADVRKMRRGDALFAIGHPIGMEWTVSSGVLSYAERVTPGAFGGGGYIQTDTPIFVGNSGGGLFDREGRLVGIPVAMLGKNGMNSGFSLAIPVHIILEAIAKVK